MATENLVIAIPSKGRLQENANNFFGKAGLKVKQSGGGREYVGTLQGVPNVDIAFQSASEIAGNLDQGLIHFGITGEDLIREKIETPEASVDLLLPLGFGHADVIVAVPQSWIDVATVADLDEVAHAYRVRRATRLRVATKYFNLTRKFFADHDLADYRIVESLGATEGAPAAGSAEVIVDITSTGTTLRANNLKVLNDGVILRSQANLVASLTANWSPTAKEAARAILDKIDARQRAEASWLITARGRFDAVAQGEALVAEHNCVVEQAHEGATGSLSLQCPASAMQAVADQLRSNGAETVSVVKAEYVFSNANPLFDRLMQRLGG